MKQTKSNGPRHTPWWRQRIAVGLAILMGLLFSSTALAAEVVSGDPYILPRGEVVTDDLYVTGGEVIIDGAVEGDLIVAAGYVEINGVVMGDLLAAGGAVVITGVIQDDVRAAGGGVLLTGSVGDDFFAAGGGGWPGMAFIPMQMEDRSVPQGVNVVASASVDGDAFIAGGQGLVAGSIGRNLSVGLGDLTFSGQVAGDADLNAQTLTVVPGAQVQGELRYTTKSDVAIPEGVASSVTQEPWEDDSTDGSGATVARNPIGGFLRWLLSTALTIVGLLVVGWLLWSFAPRQIIGPVATIEARPMEAGILGLLAAVAVLPVSAALTFLAVLFWGWFPGGLFMASFLFGLFALLWLISPIFTGLWVGRKIVKAIGIAGGELLQLLIGIAAIVLIARVLTIIPFLGDLAFQMIYLASFALTVGSWILARRRPAQVTPALSGPQVKVF